MCYIELVDYNENMLDGAQPKAEKKTRRRRSKKSAETVEATTENTVEASDSETATDEPTKE